MLFKGRLLEVGTKEEIRASQHPAVRNFLNRTADNPVHAPAVTAYLERYVQNQGAKP
jgi:ABC-type transporter Mla maintaining outer membrane lipid asymmetry ATPase subunit MlaF